ncbi:nuclear factor 7, brain-like, partial [Protopterus annectens]|uniref:nuclear factor 7, brain-like n=1 Tax=Protopterus annectens TaxID=7888 RepID=UPI001CFBC416
MASSHLQSADFMEELICSVCLELFIQPVILECGHNYCKTCIDNVWESEGTPKCPECRAPNPGKKYTLNRLLSRLVEKTQSLDLEDRLSPTLASPPANVSRDVQLCDAHGEGMKLFCEDCRCPACLVCKGSIKHRGHSFLPLQEAEQLQRQKYEHELKLMSSALESQLKILQHVQSKQEQKKTDIQNETQVLKQYISSEFAKMYKFLHEKEEYLIQQLRNEEAEILKDVEFSLAKVQEKAGAIQKEIAEIQSLLQQHGVDDIALLKATRNLIRKNQIEMQEDIDFKGHITSRNQRLGVFRGPLQYSVWKEMKSIISPAPALLLLDPETACRNLILSADLTSAR